MTVNSRSAALGCSVSRTAADARKPVGSFPKSSTARRVARDCAAAVAVRINRQKVNAGKRFRSFMNERKQRRCLLYFVILRVTSWIAFPGPELRFTKSHEATQKRSSKINSKILTGTIRDGLRGSRAAVQKAVDLFLHFCRAYGLLAAQPTPQTA